MRIRYSAPCDIAESGVDTGPGPISDPVRLRALDGVRDTGEESFVEYLADYDEFAEVLDRIRCDGVFVSYDAGANSLRYVTEYEVDGDLTDEQQGILRDHTVNMWQEGIGVAFAQVVLTDRHAVVVLGDDQVGNRGLTVEVTA